MEKIQIIRTTIVIALVLIAGISSARGDGGSAISPCVATAESGQTESSQTESRCARRWIVNTRCLPTPACNTLQATGWSAVATHGNTATTAELFAEDGPPIVIYVHGYMNSQEHALSRSELICKSISSCCTAPVDFVLWSWPTEQSTGLLRDVRQKAARADGEAAYFANFLQQLPPTRTRIVFTYSMGARVVSKAYHNQAIINAGSTQQPKAFVAMIAAATNYDWLGCDGCAKYAMSQMECLLLIKNWRDPALKHYGWVEPYRGTKALGYAGPSRDTPRGILTQVDLANEVGRSHGLDSYFNSPTFRYRMKAFMDAATANDADLSVQ